jgi:hypothetical protein
MNGLFTTDYEELPKFNDLTLSMDVIYHLIEDEVYNDYMTKLVNLKSKYLIIYANNEDKNFAAHMKSRKFTENELLNENYKLHNQVKNQYPYDGVKGSVSQWFIYHLK